METKPLLFGLIGFFLGGLLVSVAATTFEQPAAEPSAGMSMSEMVETLEGKQGDEYDKAFIEAMIEHHEGAIEMAELSADSARHEEIKQLSREIILTQRAEIEEMEHWRAEWGYSPDHAAHDKKNTH